MPPKDTPKIETFVKTDDGRVINMANIKTINITDEKLSEYIFTLSTSGYQDSDGLVTITGRCTGEKIIRCRDCKYYSRPGWCARPAVLYKDDGFGVEDNDFCSKGIAIVKEDD